MSKKCPYCGSYNTEISVGNYVGRGLINAGRGAIAIGAHMIGGLFCPSVGTAAGHTAWHNVDPGEFKEHYCCNCGRDFSA